MSPSPNRSSPAAKTPDPANDDMDELDEPEPSSAPETQDDDELDEFEELEENRSRIRSCRRSTHTEIPIRGR